MSSKPVAAQTELREIVAFFREAARLPLGALSFLLGGCALSAGKTVLAATDLPALAQPPSGSQG
eukprot:7019784-Pyramimonas_sp.AAC.1